MAGIKVRIALVLGGGNALGAYHGGVAEALSAAGLAPHWVAGSSIGAVCAALIAGNERASQMAALHEFWRRAAQADMITPWLPAAGRASLNLATAAGVRVFGRPRLFQPKFGPSPGYFTSAPMRSALLDLVDWDRLNGGGTRLSALAVDLETGEDVVFDTARERVSVDHVLASAALIPDFAPVSIGGQVLVDGGFSANTPVDLVLGERPSEAIAAFVADPFPRRAPLPVGPMDALARHSDLLFAAQTRRTLRAMEQLWSQRSDAAPGACYCVEYEPPPEDEMPLKGYAFSERILRQRWMQGRRDMEAAIGLFEADPPHEPGLRVHGPIRGTRLPSPPDVT